METSDSEYFESADEEFRSDDETQIEKKKSVNQSAGSTIRDKTEKLSISDDIVCKSSDKNEKNTNLKENIVEKDEKNMVKNDDSRKIDEGENKITNEERHATNKIRSDITECWEPGINYEFDENTKDKNGKPKRPEFGIPPARVGGCFPIIKTNDNREHSDNSSCRPKFKIPPAVSSSGFARERKDVETPTRSHLKNKPKQDTSTKTIDKKERPKRPEFGIPPARPTCWVPGVTDTKTVSEPFEPHPAYIKLMKERNANVEENMWEKEEDWADFDIPSEQEKPKDDKRISSEKENKSSEEHMEKRSANVEKNMWGNLEDWDTFDIPSEQEKPKDDKEISSEKGNKSSKGNMEKRNANVEKKIWENLEDWDTFDIPSVQEKPKDDKGVFSEKKNKSSEENMWEDDNWEPVETNSKQQHMEKPSASQQIREEKTNWSDWGSWGLSSVISTATTLTNQVSQGITNALETGIGAPDPEELARINKLEKEKIKQMTSDSNEEVPMEKPILGFGLGNLVQGVTKLVETTGTKVISGGLDTLETIGKKTMEVLQENDPGLKKKRAFLKLDDDKPILSQVLREAKEKAEKENKELEKKHFARKANYETLFDDHQGLVHLEALEMLSKQCDIKLQSLLESTTGDALNEMQETMDQVKELCELPEEDEEETLTTEEITEKLESAVSEINVKITYNRLLTTWQEVEDWLLKLNLRICNQNELHQQAIESLAQLTAIAVEQFHKAGELLLVKDHRSTADEADSLVQLTTTLTALIGIVAARFSEKLNMIVADGADDKEEVNSLITNVFFEAANSSSYIQDAFQLLMPVLQVGAV